MGHPSDNDRLNDIIRWGESQPLVRAMILTSTRAIPNGEVDQLSDYDVILILKDIRPFAQDRRWLEAFGPVLALYQDPLETHAGYPRSGNVVQFENDLKIDFHLWQVEYFQQLVAAPVLPEEFDAGYQVLLDKDGLGAVLKPPTYRAYIPKPPSEAEYLENVEVFFVDAAYVAKFLWRDDVMAAKEVLDHFIKQEHLRPMLEWHYEIEHGWSVKPGVYGRRMKKWLRPDLWQGLESTYAGASIEENWQALFNTVDFMRRVSKEVGEKLGYAYPDDLHRRAVAHLKKVRIIPSDA